MLTRLPPSRCTLRIMRVYLGSDHAGYALKTHLLTHLAGWPEGLRVFVRRVKPLRDTTPKPLTGVDQLERVRFSCSDSFRL